jgi:hypothetical protein
MTALTPLATDKAQLQVLQLCQAADSAQVFSECSPPAGMTQAVAGTLALAVQEAVQLQYKQQNRQQYKHQYTQH